MRPGPQLTRCAPALTRCPPSSTGRLTPGLLPPVTAAAAGASFLPFGSVAKNTVPGMCSIRAMYAVSVLSRPRSGRWGISGTLGPESHVQGLTCSEHPIRVASGFHHQHPLHPLRSQSSDTCVALPVPIPQPRPGERGPSFWMVPVHLIVCYYLIIIHVRFTFSNSPALVSPPRSPTSRSQEL